MAEEQWDVRASLPPPIPMRSPLRDRPFLKRHQTEADVKCGSSAAKSCSFRDDLREVDHGVKNLQQRRVSRTHIDNKAGTNWNHEFPGEDEQEDAAATSSASSLSEGCTLKEFFMSETASMASSLAGRSVERTASRSSSVYSMPGVEKREQSWKGEGAEERVVSLQDESGTGLRCSESLNEYGSFIRRSMEQAMGKRKEVKVDAEIHEADDDETNSTISSYDGGGPALCQESFVYDKDSTRTQSVKSDTASETHTPVSSSVFPLSPNSTESDIDARTENWLARGLATPPPLRPILYQSRSLVHTNHTTPEPPSSQPQPQPQAPLPLFPPISPSSGRREYFTPTISSIPRSPISPLNNGRDVYGNWIDSSVEGYMGLKSILQVTPILHKEQSVPCLRGGWGGFWGTGEKGGEAEGKVRGRSQTVPVVAGDSRTPPILKPLRTGHPGTRPPLVGDPATRPLASGNPSTRFIPRRRPTLELQAGSLGSAEQFANQKRPSSQERDEECDNLSEIFNKHFGISSPTTPKSPDRTFPASPKASGPHGPTISSLEGYKHVGTVVRETGGLRSPTRGSDSVVREMRGRGNAAWSPTTGIANMPNTQSMIKDKQYPYYPPHPSHNSNKPASPSPELRSPTQTHNIDSHPEPRLETPTHLSSPMRSPPVPPTQTHDTTDTRSLLTIDSTKLPPLDREIFSSGVYETRFLRKPAHKERKEREKAEQRWIRERERERVLEGRREEERRRRLATFIQERGEQVENTNSEQGEKGQKGEQKSVIGSTVGTLGPGDSVSVRSSYRSAPPSQNNPHRHPRKQPRHPPRRNPDLPSMAPLLEDNESLHAHHPISTTQPSRAPTSKPSRENMNSIELGLHLTNRLVKFLLAAPKEPDVKTYSRRYPPLDTVAREAAARPARHSETTPDTGVFSPGPPRGNLWSRMHKKSKGRLTSSPEPGLPGLEITHTALHSTIPPVSSPRSAYASYTPRPPAQRNVYMHRTPPQHQHIAPRHPAPSSSSSRSESTIPDPHHLHNSKHKHKYNYPASDTGTAWPATDEWGDVRDMKESKILGLRGGGGDAKGERRRRGVRGRGVVTVQ